MHCVTINGCVGTEMTINVVNSEDWKGIYCLYLDGDEWSKRDLEQYSIIYDSTFMKKELNLPIMYCVVIILIQLLLWMKNVQTIEEHDDINYDRVVGCVINCDSRILKSNDNF